ncbi:MAG: hypothetical protein ORN21_07025 [Methylophilaceae bacterium]|nr:hypothetical protein [Methylophilaceae bacterium]
MQGVSNAGGSPINEIGEPPSSAPQSHSPVQTVLQRSPNVWFLVSILLTLSVGSYQIY